MNTGMGLFVAWGLALALVAVTQWKKPGAHGEALKKGFGTARTLLTRLPIIVIAVSLLVMLVPQQVIADRLGSAAGFEGILYGSLLGGFLPGGPSIAFPVVVVLMTQGAQGGPLIALITAWSVLAVHRMLFFEIPFLGIRFAALRFVSSLILPPIAGVLAGFVLH
jgi:uncharacterized membrane protein YraQ (UPF0718 family)